LLLNLLYWIYSRSLDLQMKYQYHDLSPEQFEELVIAVCFELLGPATQGFSTGTDGGRDARFHGKAQAYKSKADLWDGLIIIQSKHTKAINEKYTEPSFISNKTSVLNKEIPKIKKLYDKGELDYYMMFSNRKLLGNANEDIINKISSETGLDKSKIVIFGIDDIETYLKHYPNIKDKIDINPFEMPLMVDPDDLAEIIIAFAKNQGVFSEVPSHSEVNIDREIKRTEFNEKNKINNLSKEYSEIIAEDMLVNYDEITQFLSHPENVKLKDLYQEVVDEFNIKIVSHKQDFNSFDRVLNYLYDLLISRDMDLKRNKKLTRTFLHYMYYFCDIGDS